jgi:hypothetical protein
MGQQSSQLAPPHHGGPRRHQHAAPALSRGGLVAGARARLANLPQVLAPLPENLVAPARDVLASLRRVQLQPPEVVPVVGGGGEARGGRRGGRRGRRGRGALVRRGGGVGGGGGRGANEALAVEPLQVAAGGGGATGKVVLRRDTSIHSADPHWPWKAPWFQPLKPTSRSLRREQTTTEDLKHTKAVAAK